jgi:MFS family permease
MFEPRSRLWTVVGVLFVSLFLIWGPVNAGSVFFIPVASHFGWSRALFSAMLATAPLSAGIFSPAVGWLLDRFGARRIMMAGAAAVALSYVALSQANSAIAFFFIFILLGVGITSSTIIPTALVLTRLFREQRGLALGIAFAGIPLGGTGITVLANFVVQRWGFRAGWMAMAAPIALIVVPLIAVFLRELPAGDDIRDDRPLPGTGALSAGLEVREALVSRSFWMIAIAEVLFATVDVGIRVHLIPLLTGVGYSPTLAARLLGVIYLFSVAGTFAAGALADRLGGRAALTLVFLAAAMGIAPLLAASHAAAIAGFVVLFGLVRETRPVLVPIALSESLGTRRIGALFGIQAFFGTLGFAAGPIIAGRIFDVSGGYSAALLLFVAMALVAAAVIRAMLPFEKQRARIAIAETAAA